MREGFHFASQLPPVSAPESHVSPNPLERYFDSVAEGPGVWKWRHYFDVYDRHLSKFVGREVHIVEIGVYSGGSLSMWLDYFGEGCHVYGVDIEPACVKHERDRVKVFIGDQSDPAFWERVIAEVPRIDVVIDDGSHVPAHQVASMKALLPHIAPDGVYICEDVIGLGGPFHGFVDGLTRMLYQLEEKAIDDGRYQASAQPVHQHVASVHRYPMLTVVEKPAARVDVFDSEQHGTVWEPGVY